MTDVVLVVDMANVVGARPDGWWRDRVGATERLLVALGDLTGSPVVHAGGTSTVTRVIAVLEGQARRAEAPAGIDVVRAEASGDDALVDAVRPLRGPVLVVTADRALRDRLPASTGTAGPGWLRDLVGA
ncbi:MAG TPA: hypothetical protein VFD41_10110 [Actinomycetales bacterium]|nr:hypothetical protein [Actinomycetales bacterium]